MIFFLFQKLPTTGAKVMVFPMKIEGGGGGPCRIVAEIEENVAITLIYSKMLNYFIPSLIVVKTFMQ